MGWWIRAAPSSDTTAPTLSSAADSANGSTGASISVSTNEGNGTLYWYISTSSSPPSAANLKSGSGAVVAGNQAVSGTGTQNASPTGLTASTAYYAHFLHRDAAGNDSSIASGDGFTTSSSIGNLRVVNNKTQLEAAILDAVDGDEIRLVDGYSTTPFLINLIAYASATTKGVAIVGNGLQVVRFKGENLSNCNFTVCGWKASADEVEGIENGDPNVVAYYSGIFMDNCTKFSFEGNDVYKCGVGMYIRGCSNANIQNNVIRDFRGDGIRIDNTTASVHLQNNYIIDPIKREKAYWYGNGTTPVFANNPGGASILNDPTHPDAIQAYTAANNTWSDAFILNNTIDVDSQGVYLGDGKILRGLFQGNSVTASYPWFHRGQDVDDYEMTSNVFANRPVMNPETSTATISLGGGHTRLKGGLNTFPPGATIDVGSTGLVLTGAVSGTATAPTASTYLTTTINVGDIATKKALPSATKYAGAFVIYGEDPQIMGSNGSVGTAQTAIPPAGRGYYYGLEDNLYTRWKLNGTIVRAATQGRAAFVYTPVAAGALTVEFSVDGSTGWRASAGKTIT